MTDKATPQGLALTEGLGPLPDAVAHVHSDGDFCQDRYYGNSGWPVALYTADQMRAYAAQERAAERERWKAMLLAAAREAYAHGRDGKDVTVECDDSGWRLGWKA